VDAAGNIYIADYNNQRIRKINIATGDINTIAGTGVSGYSGDSGLAVNAKLSYPSSICLDSPGNIYFTEFGNNTVRKINAETGIINTVAGNGTEGYSGNGHLAINAQLGQPSGIFIDKHNYLYIAEFNNNVIRLVTPDGYIYTIAGTGAYGWTGDGGSPLAATFRNPTGVCVDDSGYVYIADGHNSVIRKMTPVDTANVGIRTIVKPTFDIYPNPANGKFSVIAGVQADADVRVLNAVGQCIYNISFTGKRIDIDLSGYPAGMYFVQYTSYNSTATQKILLR
jgi:hypothetical protein